MDSEENKNPEEEPKNHQKGNRQEQEQEKKKNQEQFEEEDPTLILQKRPPKEYATTFIHFLRRTFNLKDGKTDIPGTIATIEEEISFQGFNVWVLICSIVVASIGLNLNSTAVIIGAMLISPLMGPIRGIGLGIGTYDFKLMVNSLKNFGIAAGSSIATSFIYFLISPIDGETSELLGRTSPTFLDVLIAFFGGLAGIISATRGARSTVVPGVAIATALMPPLCTAGYGVAMGNFNYFIGAFYLFLLNSLFICLSTIIVVRFMKFPFKEYVNPKIETKVKWMTTGFLLIMIIPSIFLLIDIIKESNFKSNAEVFVEEVVGISDDNLRYDVNYNYEGEYPMIEIDISHGYVTHELENLWKKQMTNYGLAEDVELKVYQTEDIDSKLEQLKNEMSESGSGNIEFLIESKEQELQTLEEKYNFYKELTERFQKNQFNLNRLSKNFQIDYPQLQRFSVLRGLESNFEAEDTIYTVMVRWDNDVPENFKDSINQLIVKKVAVELETSNGIEAKNIKVFDY